MPFGDRTGPAGLGPRTGRGAGFCAGFGIPGFLNRAVSGWGFFCRGGGGRGWRNWYYATGLTGWQRALGALGWWPAFGPPYAAPSREQELEQLKNQARYFESALENIRKRITALDSKTETA